MMNITNILNAYQTRVITALEKRLPPTNQSPNKLHNAMHYSVFIGGKRIRPALVYATGGALNVDLAQLDAAACAVELIHTFSLVHDDLPAMDNDDLRRGKPTCHKEFDEATAILVGDALQSLAFECLAENPLLNATQCLNMVKLLSHASGSLGMAGGQSLDLATSQQSQFTLKEVETIHRLKTGALIIASVKLGLSGSTKHSTEQASALEKFANYLGLAFQIQDDILDIEGTTEILGKKQGADIALNKATYPQAIGLDKAKEKANELAELAQQQLMIFDKSADSLRMLANHIVKRNF